MFQWISTTKLHLMSRVVYIVYNHNLEITSTISFPSYLLSFSSFFQFFHFSYGSCIIWNNITTWTISFLISITLSMLILMLILGLFIDLIFKWSVSLWILFIFLIYLYKAMRKFYGQGRVKTIVNFSILNTIFFILAFTTASFLFILSILFY